MIATNASVSYLIGQSAKYFRRSCIESLLREFPFFGVDMSISGAPEEEGEMDVNIFAFGFDIS